MFLILASLFFLNFYCILNFSLTKTHTHKDYLYKKNTNFLI
jgi:hypothetical protein